MEDIERLMVTATTLLSGETDFRDRMEGRVLCPVFFQDSSRTFINSTSSFLRMGGTVLPLNVANTRIGSAWSEPIRDFCTLLNATCDVAIIRVPTATAMTEFAKHLSIPFINAGNGIGKGSEHPMQALIDLFTLREAFGARPLKILMIGGIHVRTTRTQFKLFRRAHHEIDLIAPPVPVANDDMDTAYASARFLDDVRDVDLSSYEVIYHNGMDEDPGVHTSEKFNIHHELLQRNGFRGKVMHSLPRLAELSTDLDDSIFNLYYRQMELSRFVFQSCFDHILHGTALGLEVQRKEFSRESKSHH
jgi:aspartate carbamoyltransferase catalytic subunit